MTILSLKNQKEFNLVNKHGSKKHGSCFIIILSKNTSSLHPLNKDKIFLGLKISKKFSKKAVIRNKARRRIKHLINLMARDSELNLTGKALIIIPKFGLEKENFSCLEKDLKKTLLNLEQRCQSYQLTTKNI